MEHIYTKTTPSNRKRGKNEKQKTTQISNADWRAFCALNELIFRTISLGSQHSVIRHTYCPQYAERNEKTKHENIDNTWRIHKKK